jgi:hypothetical protein
VNEEKASGAEAHILFARFAARLKVMPCYKSAGQILQRTCGTPHSVPLLYNSSNRFGEPGTREVGYHGHLARPIVKLKFSASLGSGAELDFRWGSLPRAFLGGVVLEQYFEAFCVGSLLCFAGLIRSANP